MPEIDERIAEFLNEKIPSGPPAQSAFSGLLARLSAAAVALVDAAERAAAGFKALLTYRLAAAASPARAALRQELADHLRDAYDHQLELGRDPEAAWAYVTGHFGDYAAILGELEALHQPAPFWEWITRALAFVVMLCSLPWVGISVKDVIIPAVAMALLLAAPLAAFDSRDWGWPAWTRWAARGLALFFFVFPAHEEGLAYGDIISAAIVIVIASLLARRFSSRQYAIRMRAWMVAVMFGFTALGFHAVLINLSTPSQLGGGIAVTCIVPLYGVLLARPRLWAVLLLTVGVQTVIGVACASVGMPLTFKAGEVLVFLPRHAIDLGLLAAWAFYGRRGSSCWFPSAALVTMILVYIGFLKNLTGSFSLSAMVLTTSVPLLLWLVPAAGMVWRKLRGE